MAKMSAKGKLRPKNGKGKRASNSMRSRDKGTLKSFKMLVEDFNSSKSRSDQVFKINSNPNQMEGIRRVISEFNSKKSKYGPSESSYKNARKLIRSEKIVASLMLNHGKHITPSQRSELKKILGKK